MPHPLLYEINTRCWLKELSAKQQTPITLANIPEAEILEWKRLGFSHIWLMGVWTTGPLSQAQSLNHPGLRQTYSEALPDWTETDVPGSPYAIADYQMPETLGGEQGLNDFRQQLHRHGLKLLLDFVPNHLGLDHPWLRHRSELFVQSPALCPDTFQHKTDDGIRWLAHGKDPYFPGWTDTVQLDYRQSETRQAMTELLLSVAARCDGVRCDMAMLLLNDVFAKTWQHFPPITRKPHSDNPPDPPSSTPDPEFWPGAIASVRAKFPDFLFLSEVYWGLEGRLQALGFDYTYDKELYDKLVARDAGGAQHHLLSLSREFVSASAHFLENHDEPRIAATLPLPEHQAAALLILGLPGMRFLHEGQLAGAMSKSPVQLARRKREAGSPGIRKFYEKVLTTLPGTAVGRGRPELLRPRAAWPDNPSGQNFVIVQWQNQPFQFDLVVVNLAPHRSQCYAPLNIENLSAHNWAMTDLLGPERYVRAGDDLENQGLYLDVPAHAAQLFHFEPQ